MRNLTGRVRYVPETTDPKRLLRVEVASGQAAVAILGASGAVMQTKVGALSEDGKRCRIPYGGVYVDATREGNWWVYRLPAETSDE